MLLVVEFIPPTGESLDETLPPMQAKLDHALGQVGFERISSQPVVSSGVLRQEISYKLTKSERVRLETIQVEIRAIEEETRGHVSVDRPWEITRFVELITYLQREPSG